MGVLNGVVLTNLYLQVLDRMEVLIHNEKSGKERNPLGSKSTLGITHDALLQYKS